MSTKFCEDCIHYRESWIERLVFGKAKAIRWAKCAAITTNADRGLILISKTIPKKEQAWCSTERDPHFDNVNPCGSTGKLFQRKGDPAPVEPPDEPPSPPQYGHAVFPTTVIPFPGPPRKEDLN